MPFCIENTHITCTFFCTLHRARTMHEIAKFPFPMNFHVQFDKHNIGNWSGRKKGSRAFNYFSWLNFTILLSLSCTCIDWVNCVYVLVWLSAALVSLSSCPDLFRSTHQNSQASSFSLNASHSRIQVNIMLLFETRIRHR